MILVSSTSSTSFLHAAECLAHRHHFQPLVHFTDTWPNERSLWSRLFPFCQGRLDVFHFMKRITDTLRQRHKDFNAAVADLSRRIFQYDEDDIAAVKRALKDGSLNNKKHSDAEINAMIEDGRFKKNYSKYIASYVFTAKTIEEKIFDDADSWVNTWLKKEDPDLGGETLGTRATASVLENQRAHCADIDDVAGHIQTLKPKPKQKHDLREKRKSRGGKVEIFHAVQGDFANGNMRPMTAQMLLEEGAVMFSMEHDAELKYQMGLVPSPDVFHFRPWMMEEANRIAEMADMPRPHLDLEELREDNGERQSQSENSAALFVALVLVGQFCPRTLFGTLTPLLFWQVSAFSTTTGGSRRSAKRSTRTRREWSTAPARFAQSVARLAIATRARLGGRSLAYTPESR